MASLSVNQIPSNARLASCKTSKCSKLNCDTFCKNHNHSLNNFSYAYGNTDTFMILHQNIRGISNKIEEFSIALPPNPPQVICLTEHHLKNEETENVKLSQYTLGTKFCRQKYSHGGVCIFVPNNIQFSPITLDQYSKEKDIEICALKLLV
jgi:hypothetical protein